MAASWVSFLRIALAEDTSISVSWSLTSMLNEQISVTQLKRWRLEDSGRPVVNIWTSPPSRPSLVVSRDASSLMSLLRIILLRIQPMSLVIYRQVWSLERIFEIPILTTVMHWLKIWSGSEMFVEWKWSLRASFFFFLFCFLSHIISKVSVNTTFAVFPLICTVSR